MEEDRKIVLLRACRDLLRKLDGVTDETVYYDDCECDIGCLLEDIEREL